jgi:hypothetical protein
VFKLVIAASKTWRRLKGTNQLPKVIAGVRFNDGIEVIHMPANHAARSPRHPKFCIARCCHAQTNIFAAREKSIRIWLESVKTNFEAVFVLFFADPKRWDSNFIFKQGSSNHAYFNSPPPSDACGRITDDRPPNSHSGSQRRP